MAGELCECRLAKVDGDVTIFQALPGKCGSKEVVTFTHKIDLDMFCKSVAEQCFFFGARQIKNKVVDIESYVDVVAW